MNTELKFNAQDTIDILAAIFDFNEIIEIRTVDETDRSKPKVDQKWFLSQDFADIADRIEEPNKITNFYFGANPRKDFGVSGDINCLPGHSFFVDVDFYKDANTFEGTLERLKDIISANKLPEPSFIVNSGNGIWLWWI